MYISWYYWSIIVVGGYTMLGFVYASIIVDGKFSALYKPTKQEQFAEKYWLHRAKTDLWKFIPGAFNVKIYIEAGGAWLIDSMLTSKRKEEIRILSYAGFWKNFLRWPLVLTVLLWAAVHQICEQYNLTLAPPPKHWIS